MCRSKTLYEKHSISDNQPIWAIELQNSFFSYTLTYHDVFRSFSIAWSLFIVLNTKDQSNLCVLHEVRSYKFKKSKKSDPVVVFILSNKRSYVCHIQVKFINSKRSNETSSQGNIASCSLWFHPRVGAYCLICECITSLYFQILHWQ